MINSNGSQEHWIHKSLLNLFNSSYLSPERNQVIVSETFALRIKPNNLFELLKD